MLLVVHAGDVFGEPGGARSDRLVRRCFPLLVRRARCSSLGRLCMDDAVAGTRSEALRRGVDTDAVGDGLSRQLLAGRATAARMEGDRGDTCRSGTCRQSARTRRGDRRHDQDARSLTAMPKRRERVAPPPSSHGWDLRHSNNDAAKGWELVCAAAPAAARQAWESITTDPRGSKKPRALPMSWPTRFNASPSGSLLPAETSAELCCCRA